MNDTVNRQILLVEKPTGKLGPEHFKMVNGKVPEPKDGEVLVRARYISLDAANRAWMHGATYRAAVEANTVMAGGGIAEVVSSKAPGSCTGRHRVRRHRLAGLCRGAGKASHQDAEDGTDDASAQRLRHRRPHRLFRPAACRQAQGRRDRRGVGRGRFGRVDRRADREDQGLQRHRHRRRQGQVPLADVRTRLRRRGRLQGRRDLQGAAGGRPQGHRRLFRQCRRRHSRSLSCADEQPRPHRLLRRDLAI